MRLDDHPDYLTANDLALDGITLEEVRRLDPPPVEYTALDGGPCWCREELVEVERGNVP
jgi:hypothetical protein